MRKPWFQIIEIIELRGRSIADIAMDVASRRKVKLAEIRGARQTQLLRDVRKDVYAQIARERPDLFVGSRRRLSARRWFNRPALLAEDGAGVAFVTNCFHAKAEWIDGAWRALVRYSHRSEYWPVMDGDRPAGYPRRDAALIAAYEAQQRHMNGTIRSFGEKAEPARIEANRIFRLGKKPIGVETKGRVRA